MEMDLIDKIEKGLSKMTKSQQIVADYIIKNPIEAAFSTISKIANDTGVSTATVIRFTTCLGFSGFADFQQCMQQRMVHKASPLDKIELSATKRKDHSDFSKMVQEITSKSMDSLNKTFEGLSSEVVERTVKDILGAEHIYICGGRSSHSVAHYLAYNLDRLFCNTDFWQSDTTMILEKLRRVSEKDLVIVISFPRYTKATVDIGRICKEQGAKVVAITDSHNSPFAQYTDYHIIAHRGMGSFQNSVMSAIYIADVLLNLCSKSAYEKGRRNLEKSEELTTKLSLFVNK